MLLRAVWGSLLILALGWSLAYSHNHSFAEMTMSADIASGERKELCINNSSDIYDLWNNRYLHIDASSKLFELYSKKTVIVEYLNNKNVGDKIHIGGKKNAYSVDVRMYFSQCYLVDNTNSDGTVLHVTAYTYRRYCYWNAAIITFLCVLLIFDPKIILNEALFFGLSITAFFVMMASVITYIPHMFLNLPGLYVIMEGFTNSLGFIVFYSVFLVAIFSFILRLSLNYYHFSLQTLHKIPRIVSTIGPLMCQYQQWIFGLYLGIALFLVPRNKDSFWVVLILGLVFALLLVIGGGDIIYHNLKSGLFVALIVLIVVPLIFMLNHPSAFSNHITEEKKEEYCVCCSKQLK